MVRLTLALIPLFFILTELSSGAHQLSSGALVDGKISFGSRLPPTHEFLVDLQNNQGINFSTARTNSSGNFQFRNVPQGLYYIVVELEGFKPYRKLFEIDSGRAFIDVGLQPEGSTSIKAVNLYGNENVVDLETLAKSYSKNAVKEYEKSLEDADKGKITDAIKRLEKALSLEPDFFEAINNLGSHYQKLQRYEEAETKFRKAHSLNRNAAQPLINIGSLWMEQDDFQPAEVVLREALRLSPRSPAALYYLGSTLYKLSQIEEAEDLLSLAIEIHPAPATRLMLVNVYLHQKEHTLVLAQLDAYLKENPDGAEIKAVETLRSQMLKELNPGAR